MKWETIETAQCPNVASDTECEQQAENNSPGETLYGEPRLVLKPAFATIEVGGVLQYRTYLQANGTEQEITTGLVYSSGTPSIGQIGVATGSAVGLAEGITAIIVEWNGMTASAQLNVVASCSDTAVGLMLLVDNSPSMGQAMPGYGSKLAFAKTVAARLANELNVAKDSAMVASFEESMTVLAAATADKPTLASAIAGIGITNSNHGTNLLAAIQSAITEMNAVSVATKVIVVMTDGVCNEIGDLNTPNVLAQIAASGMVVVAVGARASGDGFNLLQLLASGGFFVNAYNSSTGQEASDLASGLKGYLCAGNCNPSEPYTINQGDPSYTTFNDWDVVSGIVDLLGNGYLDFLPGHGLYVSLCGIGVNEADTLTLENIWNQFMFPQWFTDPNVMPSVNFAHPKIVDGVRIRSVLFEVSPGFTLADYNAGILHTFRVEGSNDGVNWTTVKSFDLDCSDPIELNNLIGPSTDTILRLNNNTAYLSYRLLLLTACGGEDGVIINSAAWYSKAVSNVPSLGCLRLKVPFVTTLYQSYQATVRLAGNQRFESYTDQVRIRIGPVGGPWTVDQTITVPWNQPFEDTVISFDEPGVAPENWVMEIEQLSAVEPGAGILLDYVQLALPPAAPVDYYFESENPQTIQPACPQAYAYLYANCGGYGCLDVPPSSQVPDPNPLTKIE